VTDSVDQSWAAAEQGTYERLRIDRALRSERASEQYCDWAECIELACYRHGVLLQGKKGNTRPRRGRTEFPAWDRFAPDGAKGLVIARVPRARKEKGPRSCELRALLRDEPSSPCTRHGRRRTTWHCRTLRSDSVSYARALDRAHNLSRLRDKIGIASDHFKGG
jgi:hypothetical protein